MQLQWLIEIKSFKTPLFQVTTSSVARFAAKDNNSTLLIKYANFFFSKDLLLLLNLSLIIPNIPDYYYYSNCHFPPSYE
jgi:hypothetical protein